MADDPIQADGMPRGPSNATQWQEFVNRIASLDAVARDASYQPVPDSTHGDGGLEGYTTDGHAFQAYFPNPSTTGKKLTTALCAKITEDLRKLERFKEFWTKTLSCTRIHTWTLVVPNYRDKNVLAHASTKAEELRRYNLPFLTDDFQALVRQPKDFPVAMKNMGADGLEHVRIPDRAVAEIECLAFQEESAEKVAELDRKLQRLPTIKTQDLLQKARMQFLRHYLAYRNGLDWISHHFPSSYDSIITRIAGLRSDIETQSLVTPHLPAVLLDRAHQALLAELNETASFLPSDQRRRISLGVVSEWLLECPLDFHYEQTG